MRKVLVVLVVLAAGTVGLGLYRGWFGFSTVRDPKSGQTEAQFHIDEKKAKADAQKAREKITGPPKEQQKEK